MFLLAVVFTLLASSACLAGSPSTLSYGPPQVHAPEPAAATLSGMGLAGVGWYLNRLRSRRRFRAALAAQAADAGFVVVEPRGQSLLGILDERFYLAVKRTADIVLASAALIVLSPFLLIIAAAIFRESPGPVFYSQERLGQGRRKFRLMKFRSMVMNADKLLKDLLAKDEALRKEFEELYKLKKDPRITRIGAFLRRTSLDELPQLINVLKGDISLVGPRPIVEAESEKYWPFEERLFSVKPGVTGLWQVSGRNDTSYEERVRLDMRYIAERSVIEDARIVLATFPAMLKRDGAY